MNKFFAFFIPFFFLLFKVEAQTNVSIIDISSNILIGGFSNGEWLESKQSKRKIKGDEEYKLYSFDGFLGTTKGDIAESMGAPCPNIYFVSTPYKKTKENLFITGITCNWDAFPKKLALLSTNQKTYIDITANLLKSKGINNPNVEITKIIKTDLENDGIDEVFINATYFKNGFTPETSVGDYSFVYLRKIINGKVENIIIDGNYFPESSNSGIPLQFQLCNILDINNDGILEFIIYSEYYEGNEFCIYRLVDNKVVLVLSAFCGA